MFFVSVASKGFSLIASLLYRRIYGGIDRSTVGLIKGHIHIEFNFDENGKLVSYEVKELFDFF